ncbi:hypothetical protein DITRI_Ditri01bG0185400 [Diplodiscus trichospermus]
MAWSAVSSAIIGIGDLLTDEAIYLWGVEEQVGPLQRELKWMQSFLQDADSRQGESERLRLWVAEIRDLAYDAEDVVESFALKIGSKRKRGFSTAIQRSACILKEGRLLHKTRSEIEKIITRITDLTRQLQTYGVKELRDGEGSSSSYTRSELRRSYPHIIEDNIVGLKDEIQELVSVLVNDESPNFRVASICGMGGLGKTTLAKRVYHHSQVRGHFGRYFAWVYVSQQVQRRKVWEDILSGFPSDERVKVNELSDEKLAERLFKFLKERKCLVILDDIWSIEAWDTLKAAFPMGDDTSRKILLTSRNKEVASYVDRRGFVLELECLKEEDSWELFQKIAFPDRDSPDCRVDERMEKLGEDMIKHCGGLPLAIIVLGGILATKNSLNEWKMVFKNVSSYLKRGKDKGIEDVLTLSYNDLPSYLRSCFLYLSHFPEDYQINAHSLIQLWVAEGIVPVKQEEGNGGEVTEDVAECYLVELVQRCMIQVQRRDEVTLKIETIQMHDLMRDLCLLKAKQENLFFTIDKSNAYSSSTIEKVRRVSAHKFFKIQRIKSPNIRSLCFFEEFFPDEVIEYFFPRTILLLYYATNHEDHNPLAGIALLLFFCSTLTEIGGIWAYIFNNFKLLRVLDVKPLREGDFGTGCKLPKGIGNLIHLRFLSLKDLRFLSSKLPSSLGNLRCLLTLDLRCEGVLFSDSIHVPNVIWRMKQLRHLYLPLTCEGKTKLKLNTLKNLQTLVNFNTKSCHAKDLFNMINLRELEIRGRFIIIEGFKEDKDMAPVLGSKCLQSLYIQSYDDKIDPRHLAHLLSNCVCICKLSLNMKIGKLPEYHYFSQDISYIYLRRTALEEDPMPTLEKLQYLRILKFGIFAFKGKAMICSAGGFPKLASLSIEYLYNLEEWKVEEGAMLALRSLELINCKKLKQLPDGLKFITTLQELKIEMMPPIFEDKLVEGGEDFYKVQHVPSVIFQDCE